MSDIEYSNLLYEIGETLDNSCNIQRLRYMCRGRIPVENENRINNARELFDELEREGHLGIDNLDVLKEILRVLKEWGWLRVVIEFVMKRNELREPQDAAVLGRAPVGVVNLKTYMTIAGVGAGFGAVAGAAIYKFCTSTPTFFDDFVLHVLVGGTTLIDIRRGSLCFNVQAENLSALKALWDMYQDGTLQKRLQEFLVTEEIKKLADGKEVEVTVSIDEQEYKDACLDLKIAEMEALSMDKSEKPREKGQARRNSDSYLHLKPVRTEEMLKIKQLENMLYLERKRRLKNELDYLFNTQLTTNETVRSPVRQSFAAEDNLFERKPTIQTERRGSDSILYSRSKESEDALWRAIESQLPRGRLGDWEQEKRHFVQDYVVNLPEMYSVISENTSESGLGISNAPSEVGTEGDNEIRNEPCFRDIDGQISDELSKRLQNDQVAWRNLQLAFELKSRDEEPATFRNIISAFPATPIRLLKDVFKALCLYDLLELLERVKVNFSSIQLRGTLHDVRALRQKSESPTSFHCKAAVVIVHDPDQHAESADGIRKFFMELDEDNDVTVVEVCLTRIMKEKELWVRWLRIRGEEFMKAIGEKEMDLQNEKFRLSRMRETDLTVLVKQESVLREKLTLVSKLLLTVDSENKSLRELKHSREMELERLLEKKRDLLSRMKRKEAELIEKEKLIHSKKRETEFIPLSALRKKEMEMRWIRKGELQEEEILELSDTILRREARAEKEIGPTRLKKPDEVTKWMQYEVNRVKEVLSETMDRWTQKDELYTFFALFQFVGFVEANSSDLYKTKLLRDKPKLLLSSGSSVLVDMLPEILHLQWPSSISSSVVASSVHETFLKRWKSLDLLSMMEEVNRTVGHANDGASLTIRNSLSHSLQFKKLEDKN